MNFLSFRQLCAIRRRNAFIRESMIPTLDAQSTLVAALPQASHAVDAVGLSVERASVRHRHV